MTLTHALRMALGILEPFQESGLYAEYRSQDKFSNREYTDMLTTLERTLRKKAPLRLRWRRRKDGLWNADCACGATLSGFKEGRFKTLAEHWHFSRGPYAGRRCGRKDSGWGTSDR